MDEFLRQLEGPTVLVRVGTGDDSRDFSIPRDLLCKKSKWFENALKDNRFQEGKNGLVSLPEDTPRAFGSFYYYIFNDLLVFQDAHPEDHTAELFFEQLEAAIEAWIFADKYTLTRMQDCALEAICVFLDQATSSAVAIPASILSPCFSHTAAASPLRILVADYVVTRMNDDKPDAAHLVSDLAVIHGFVQALHEAQSFHHDAKKDTRRRYQRPRHFADLLSAQKGDWDKMSTTGYGTCWVHDLTTCYGCGFAFRKVKARCLNCTGPDKKCWGVCDIEPLCKYCASEKPAYQA